MGRRHQFWRVENGEIVGETTPEKVMKQNSFLIWRGGTVKDFELKVEFRMKARTAAFRTRSSELPNIGKWVLKGYQADLDFTEGYVGNVHDERGRAPTGEGHVVLSRRGEITRVIDGRVQGGRHHRRSDAAPRRDEHRRLNQYHIIARGPVMMQLINGQLRRSQSTRIRSTRLRKGCSDSRCTSDRLSRWNTGMCCMRKIQ